MDASAAVCYGLPELRVLRKGKNDGRNLIFVCNTNREFG